MVKSVGVSYKLSFIQHLQWHPRDQLIRIQPLVSVNGHQNFILCSHKQGTSKHIFCNYSNLNLAWGISESTLLKLLQLNVRQHGPITQAHSTTCCRTSFSMQSVPDPKVYFPGTSTPEGPHHTGPAPWRRIFHPFALLHPRHLHHQHQHLKNP